MKASMLYRIAAVLLVLFAAGHTYGFLKFRSPTPEGMAVLDAMNRVHFSVGSANFSYGGFYRGFGLFVTVYLLFAAFIAWHLAALAPAFTGKLGWAFFAVQIASLVLSWIYFSAPPVLLSAVIAACVGWAAAIVDRAARSEPSALPMSREPARYSSG